MPDDFWDFTLREVLCLIGGERSRDEANWNRTASMMAMTAQMNAKKGKTFSPADFHPYLKASGGSKGTYDTSTKEGIMALAEKLKKF
jgi:hypothetical protein